MFRPNRNRPIRIQGDRTGPGENLGEFAGSIRRSSGAFPAPGTPNSSGGFHPCLIRVPSVAPSWLPGRDSRQDRDNGGGRISVFHSGLRQIGTGPNPASERLTHVGRLGLCPERVGSETQPTWLRPEAALGKPKPSWRWSSFPRFPANPPRW